MDRREDEMGLAWVVKRVKVLVAEAMVADAQKGYSDSPKPCLLFLVEVTKARRMGMVE